MRSSGHLKTYMFMNLKPLGMERGKRREKRGGRETKEKGILKGTPGSYVEEMKDET